MVVAIMFTSGALLALGVTTPHAQAMNAPSCLSAVPSPVQGTPVPTPTAPGTLFLNEVLPNPQTAWNCADQHPSSNDAWVEMYNTQQQAVLLTTAHLTFSAPEGDNLTYDLSPSSVIAGHGFLVVFPLVGSQASTLSSLQLIIGNTVIDSITLPTLLPDQSYARIPDGGANWQISNYPTIGASNLLNAPTATPSPPRIKKVHTPHVSRRGIKYSRNQGNDASSTTDSATADGPVMNDGLQPSWHALQLPEMTPSSLPVIETTTPRPANQQPAGEAGTSDLPKLLIVSSAVIVLGCILLWCRRFFTSP